MRFIIVLIAVFSLSACDDGGVDMVSVNHVKEITLASKCQRELIIQGANIDMIAAENIELVHEIHKLKGRLNNGN